MKSEKRTDDVKELLRILQEENAEVIQAISKIFRFGEDTRWPPKDLNTMEENITNLEQLELELGDVFCVLQLLMEKGYIREDKVYEYAELKREKIKIWTNIKV